MCKRRQRVATAFCVSEPRCDSSQLALEEQSDAELNITRQSIRAATRQRAEVRIVSLPDAIELEVPAAFVMSNDNGSRVANPCGNGTWKKSNGNPPVCATDCGQPDA